MNKANKPNSKPPQFHKGGKAGSRFEKGMGQLLAGGVPPTAPTPKPKKKGRSN